MKINFTITNGTVELLSNTDTGDNTLIINGTEIPSSDWTGSGYYTYDGISIQKIADNTGNIYCNKITATTYVLNREVPVSGGGHVILDETGVSMPQRAKLQFDNCDVQDDAVNDKTVVTANEGMAFVLANRTLTFSNNVATVTDSRVTANTYATVYFHDGSLAAAVNAGLSVDTSTGTITITAESTPSAALTCDIVCESGTGGGSISHQIAELRDDVDALDTLMGDTDISGIGNGTATGAISTINSNLSAHSFGTSVNITSYNTNVNQYTIPSDGYIQLLTGDTQDDNIYMILNNALNLSAKTHETNRHEYNDLFVKKGMTVYISANTGNRGTALFMPLQ